MSIQDCKGCKFICKLYFDDEYNCTKCKEACFDLDMCRNCIRIVAITDNWQKPDTHRWHRGGYRKGVSE